MAGVGWMRKLGLSGVSVLLCLGAIEAGMRLAGPPAQTTLVDHPDFDRSRFYHVPADEQLHPWTRGDGAGLTVAVIGDSITFGAAVQPYDRYGARLEYLLNLNPAMPPAAVHVIAREGTSTPQQQSLLDEALTLDPDVVVLGMCANDMEDWAEPAAFKAWRDDALARPAAGPWGTVTRTSRVAAWIHARREYRRSNRAHLAYYRKLYDPTYSGRQRTEQALAAFRSQCDDAGATFLVVFFPLLSWDLDESRYPFHFVHASLADIAESAGFRLVDLYAQYRGKRSHRLEAIPRRDGHPNEIGHRIAAETIFAVLLDDGVIDPGYASPHPWSRIDYWELVNEKMRKGGYGL